MEWLFERMIELAAWVAFALGLFFFGGAVWNLLMWIGGVFPSGTDGATFAERLATHQPWLTNCTDSGNAFIFSALAMGLLACIDRYVFDAQDDA